MRPKDAARAGAALIVVGLLLAAAAQGAPGDWNRVDDPMQGAVGLHLGKIGGTGLAFKGPILWFLQLQVAGGIWNTRDDRRHDIGAELQYILRQDPSLRLFLLGGVAYDYHKDRQRHENGEEFWRTRTHANYGFGVGIEKLIGERWAVKTDLDFTIEGDTDNVRPWPQIGLFFYW
jgi:hypothetical protein